MKAQLTKEDTIKQMVELDVAGWKLDTIHSRLRKTLTLDEREDYDKATKKAYLDHHQRMCCLVNTSIKCECGLKWCQDCEGKEPLYGGSEIIICRFCGKNVLPSDYCA